MNWTREQKEAIETTGKNILVSAAAGSGKTTVLVERIINLVLHEGADIDRFLITTFTKAAASEMKQRLETAIRIEMKKPGADRKHLADQLRKLPMASIGTFHSFASDVIRQYFYLTDLEPGFGIGDEVQMSILKNRALDEVFNRRYEEDTPEFREFILKYSGAKGDGGFKENILDTYRNLVSIPDYMEWAREKAEILNSESPMIRLKAFGFLAEEVKKELLRAAEYYRQAAETLDPERMPDNYRIAMENADSIDSLWRAACDRLTGDEEAIKNALSELAGLIASIKLRSQAFKKEGVEDEDKEAFEVKRKKGKAGVDRAKELLTTDFGLADREMKEVYTDTLYYIGLIEEFVEVFKGMKTREKVVDFDDIMHLALDILNTGSAADELREKFDYIFIDEYQDSNYLQEVIIGRIARDDNLFMVGDVKQCIYKFRLAEPELFVEKANRYRSDGEKSILISLNRNYRSKKYVTEPINDVFSRVMEGYDSDAELNCTAGDEHTGFPAGLHIINREELGEDAPGKADAEARVIAEIIKERLGQTIFDSKKSVERPLMLRDFAVIARSNRTVENIERYLINEGIDAYGEGSGKYFETVEVGVFLNLLRIIINMRQDIPLISAMKSVVFGFKAGELAQIRIEGREGSFHSAVMEYIDHGSKESVKQKIVNMIETVALWKEKSRTAPLEELMETILYDTGYYEYCSGLPMGNQRISNLRLIVDKAADYERISHGGLFGFLRYVEAMKDTGQTEAEAKIIGEQENVVRVMSVHKSKGLEFPVVILANAAGKITGKGSRHRINIHRKFGIGLPVVNTEYHWHRRTFLQKLIENRLAEESLEEEIRILYVALTRAKDGLEIVGTVKDGSALDKDVSTDSYLSMLYGPLSERSEVRIVEHAELSPEHGEYSTREESLAALDAKAASADYNSKSREHINRRLGFRYSSDTGHGVKQKYSVSELNRSHEAAEIPVAAFSPEIKDAGLSAAQIGTVVHLIMEKASFTRAVEEGRQYIQSVADNLLADETILPEEYDEIKIDSISAFFDTEIGRRCARAEKKGKLFKEREFIAEGELEGERIIVQGIIDCCFEEDGKLVLIDYKNSSLAGRTAEDVTMDYSRQLALYAKALEGATGMEVSESYIYLFKGGVFVRR
ncbi:MAG: UvrD-helicase domain-containing protein [Lentihominibacter sp.]